MRISWPQRSGNGLCLLLPTPCWLVVITAEESLSWCLDHYFPSFSDFASCTLIQVISFGMASGESKQICGDPYLGANSEEWVIGLTREQETTGSVSEPSLRSLGPRLSPTEVVSSGTKGTFAVQVGTSSRRCSYVSRAENSRHRSTGMEGPSELRDGLQNKYHF